MGQAIGTQTTVRLGQMGIKRIYRGTTLVYERGGSALYLMLTE